MVPGMLAAAAIGGAFDEKWALGALVVGLFAVVLLIGWWAVPSTLHDMVALVAVATAAAVVLVAAIVGLTILAEDHTNPRSTTTTTSSTNAVRRTESSRQTTAP